MRTEQKITLKTIAQLRQESVRFTIDAYQRGFRWTQVEIRDLLRDVREFSFLHPAESGAFYCLQPVVVVPDGDGTGWKVIDGQQRLTALYLFYCCYSWLAPPEERYNLIPFTVSYVGKPRLQACLEALMEKEYVSARKIAAEMAEYEDDMDCHYLLQAYQCIGDVLQEIVRSSHTRKGLRNLKETFDFRVKLIWEETSVCDAAAEAALFAKRNTGKILLTNAELIKALLLGRDADDAKLPSDPADGADMRAGIAAQWNDMEAQFAEPRFWSFLTGGRRVITASGTSHSFDAGENIADSPTRLDLLFHAMALDFNRTLLPDAEKHYPDEAPWTVSESANRERFSFYVFSSCLRLLRRRKTEEWGDGSDCVTQIWECAREVCRSFRNWYESPRLYHRVGFLLLASSRPVPELLLELLTLYRGSPAALLADAGSEEPDSAEAAGTLIPRLQAFEENLLRLIRREVFGPEQMTVDACRDWVTGLTYTKDARSIRQVLLLYNLAYLEAGGSSACFPLERYRDTRLNWDLEHINAVSDSVPGDDRRDTETNARRQWLKKAAGLQELGQIATVDGRPVQDLIPALLEQKTYLDHWQPGTPDFVQVYEAVIRSFEDTGGPDHSIGNLTLLDSSLNRACGNDVFPLKRKIILDHSIRGAFIPLCTEKVFLGSFSESEEVPRWREPEKRAYTEDIIGFLSSFLRLESEARQAEESREPSGDDRLAEADSQDALPSPMACDQVAETEGIPAGEARQPYDIIRHESTVPDEKRQQDPEAAGRRPEENRKFCAERARLTRRNALTADSAVASKESLWNLISKHGYTVCIPPLQRDYAHGRTDAQTERVRKNLLDDLFGTLRAAAEGESENCGLDLGFIYGSVDKNRRFIPVDGQQRLTTLLLLHWLLALQSGRLRKDPSVRSALLRFQYETRETSLRFWQQLVLRPPSGAGAALTDTTLSGQIRNTIWFDEEYDRDPTVCGMLVMLDALRERTTGLAGEGVSANILFSLLTAGSCPAWFRFLNLGDAGLSDSIYIKMNARGRPLTFFESFKAELLPYLRQEADASFSDAFLRKLNGPWTKFFWQKEYRPQGSQPVTDRSMLRFFRFVMITDTMVNARASGQTEIRSAVTSLLQEPDEVFFARLFRDGFREVCGLSSEEPPVTARTFQKTGKLLDLLASRRQATGSVAFLKKRGRRVLPLEEETAFRHLIGAEGDRTPDYEEMILIYAEFAFLLRYAHADGRFRYHAALGRWLRLIANLTRNVLNLQADVLFRIIRATYSLVESGFALHCEKELLQWPKLPEALSAFPAAQVKEEALKAFLMQNDRRWKKTVPEAEGVFPGGRIDMLFDFAGIRSEGPFIRPEPIAAMTTGAAEQSGRQSATASGAEYNAFQRYLRRYLLLFDRSGVRPELERESLLRRALLCYGGEDSYLLPPGKPRQCFLDNTDRDVGFRRLFRDDNSGRRAVLKQLLDDLDETQSAAPQLQEIIRRKAFRGGERWKEYLVTMPEIFNSVRSRGADAADPMGEWVFQTEQRFICRNHADDILLLSRSQTRSVNREYYTYVLFLKARQRGFPVFYHADYTGSAEKYAWFESDTEGRIRILYRNPDGKGWRYMARREKDSFAVSEGNLKTMLEYIAGGTESATGSERPPVKS